MRKYIIYLLLILFTFSSCAVRYGNRNPRRIKTSIPTGKYRNPTIFSRVNPFQGRAEARLWKNKRKKNKLFERRKRVTANNRKGKRPGKGFNAKKRKMSKGRISGSGSRSKFSSGSKKNKTLFNTKKK